MEWGAGISAPRPTGEKQAEGTAKFSLTGTLFVALQTSSIPTLNAKGSCSGKRSQDDAESPELPAAAEISE